MSQPFSTLAGFADGTDATDGFRSVDVVILEPPEVRIMVVSH